MAVNNDIEDDIEGVIEPTIEEEEFWEEPAKKKSLGSKIGEAVPKAYRKKLFTSFGIIVVGILLFIFFSATPKKDAGELVEAVATAEVDIPQDSATEAPIYGSNSPESIAIDEEEDRVFTEAAETGETSVANLTFFDKAVDRQNEALTTSENFGDDSEYYESMVETQQTRPTPGATRNRRTNIEREQLRVAYDFALMLDEVSIDTSNWSNEISAMYLPDKAPSYSSSIRQAVVEVDPANQSSAQSQSANTTTVNTGDEAAPVVGSYHTIMPTEVQWVQLISECNTDDPGIIGEIFTGKLRGSRLMGTCTITPSKRILVQFNSLILRDQVVGIDAIALDPQTLRQTLAGRINNHYFSRYAPFVIANFSAAYAQSLTSMTTTTVGDDTSVEEVSEIPDSKDQLRYAGGKTLETFLPIWSAALARPATGTIKQHTVLTTMFRTQVAIN